MNRDEIMSILLDMRGRFTALSASDKKSIEEVFETVFQRPFIRRSCSDCYRDAVIQLLTYLKKNEPMEKRSNYKLKPGIILRFDGDTQLYNNFNLTDEIAEKKLRNNKKAIGLFYAYPQDWEDRISFVKADIEDTEAPEETVKKKGRKKADKIETPEETVSVE